MFIVSYGCILLQDDDSVKSSWFASLFNLANTAIGAGTLALPFTLRQSGMVVGVFMIVAVGVLSCASLHMLNLAGQASGKVSYISVAKAAYGWRGEYIVSTAMFILLLGPSSAYFNIVGE
jgi:sodium-coupled neutral amino acid transporter 11